MCVDTVHQFVERINAHDVQGIVALMTDDHRFIDSAGAIVAGRDRMEQGWATYFRIMTDYHIEVRETLSSGNTVVLLGNAKGMLSTNETVNAKTAWRIPAAWRAVVRDSRVEEWQVYADNDAVRQVLSAAADQRGRGGWTPVFGRRR